MIIADYIKAKKAKKTALAEYRAAADRILSATSRLCVLLDEAQTQTRDPKILLRISKIRAQAEACINRSAQLDIAVKECNKDSAKAICATMMIISDEMTRETQAFMQDCKLLEKIS